uniref:Gfo/Idh/MocA family protein n=1 Tax=Daejeonella sp. TaxID=2805397 RepID=UPI00404B83DA
TYVEKMKENGVELVDSIQTLLSSVDVVMLMTFDGHPRVEQAMEVIKAGKPLFINKPFAASLKDVIKIMDTAKKYNCPIFSSSPTRYLNGAQAARNGSIGDIMGADSYSGCPLEPTHPDFYWYGIHGIEILFTMMGKDCHTVQRRHTQNTDHVVGIWDNDRIGTYRGIRKGKVTHSGVAYGLNEILPAGSFNDVGHRPLVIDMLKFFKTGISPVEIEETLAIHVFMEAADESKRQGGIPISMKAVLATAKS